jgi:hypothetical protein
MNLFEVSTLLSPVGGAVGVGMAIHRHSSSSSASFLVGIPLGLICGFSIYRGLMKLVILKITDPPTLSSWRSVSVLGTAIIAPYLSAYICYWTTILIYHLAA